MNLNNLYNFKNSIRHFVNINNVIFPEDISNFDKTDLVWSEPFNFRIRKIDDKYRMLKLPNVLNFRRAYEEFVKLDNFDDIQSMDSGFKRLSANMDTGDFTEGEYDKQLEIDFERLSIYDNMIKIDIKEYYGRIYTHYLGLDSNETFLTNMNLGQTNGLIMGNYISLYCAELYLTKISNEIKKELAKIKDLECEFSYFSDDFFFFCNKEDNATVIKIFDQVLDRYQLERNDNKSEFWTYEKFNKYNMVTRYWKKVIAISNTRFKKYIDESTREIKKNNKLYFINQLVYRMSNLEDDKLKKVFINNFFKTKFFRELDLDKYQIRNYDYHQLCFLFKTTPECLLYSIDKFLELDEFNKEKIKKFFLVRYKESLKKPFNDEQLFYYYAIKKLNLNSILIDTTSLVINSDNQILISYYLKENLFNHVEIDLLKQMTDEKYWFQSYHLILYTKCLRENLEKNIKIYLIPNEIEKILKENKKQPKIQRYTEFYKQNLINGIEMIESIDKVNEAINKYLELKIEESQVNIQE
ncbi:MAG: hypothetical protein ACRCTZ_11415 [Sarcina sp.]